MRRYVVVGGGLAGHRAALRLRELCDDAQVVLISDEDCLPYDRPPLSKEFLLSEADASSVCLGDRARYDELDIDYRPGTRISAIDRTCKFVQSTGGERFAYDRLLLATGSRVRELPCAPPSGKVLHLRTVDDAVRLRSALRGEGRRLTIVGGGFVGLEVASAAVKLGCRVTVVEAASRILSRSVPDFVSRYVKDLHQRNGVGILLDRPATRVDEVADGVRLHLEDSLIESDLLLVAIGIVPNVELALASALDVRDGILVDQRCRTNDESIFAAGEVTAFPTAPDGLVRRIESWRVASKQPIVAAGAMAGGADVFDDLPWLWSDQFGMNLQAIGSANEGPVYRLVRGGTHDSWTLLSVSEDGQLNGAIAVNRGRDISLIRRTISRGERGAETIFPTSIPMAA